MIPSSPAALPPPLKTATSLLSPLPTPPTHLPTPILSVDSLFYRMISGSCGALLVALAVSPLDVVKVRQQAYSSPSPKPNAAQAVNVAGVAVGDVVACRTCGTLIFHNGLMDCLTTTSNIKPLISPSPSIKNPYHTKSIPSILRYILKTEGIGGIYAGLGPTLIMAVPNTVLYFTAYDMLRGLSVNSSDNSYVSVFNSYLSQPLWAGMTSRVFASAVISPLELVRTRSMNASVALPKPQSKASLAINTSYDSIFKDIIKREGVKGLWSGLVPTLWRDVPFSGIYWVSMEYMKTELTEFYRGKAGSNNDKQLPAFVEWSIAFVSGLTGGVIASNFTTPFDVVKTRRQTDVNLSSSSPSSSSSSTKQPSHTQTLKKNADNLCVNQQIRCTHNGASVVAKPLPSTQSLSTLQTIVQIYKFEGLEGLWRGNFTRCLRVGPACAIMISTYVMGKRFAGVD